MSQLGRNIPCPCGSGKKYKHCCLGKIDWCSLLNTAPSLAARQMSLRGKNQYFTRFLLGVLQLDDAEGTKSHQSFKRAFTTDAIRAIYSEILEIWPDAADFERVGKQEASSNTALYTGTYEPEAIQSALLRHCLYNDKLLFVDPFIYPLWVREEFNPIVHPEKYHANTIRAAKLWLALAPWVEHGLVGFIRTPGDFDFQLKLKTISTERERFEKNDDLRQALDECVDGYSDQKEMKEYREHILLSHPNETLVDQFVDDHPNATPQEIIFFLEWLERKRNNHAYYTDQGAREKEEFFHFSTGANYEMAKMTARMTASHLVTDLKVRWMEIEYDRAAAKIDLGGWSPFAKAWQGISLSYLNNIPLDFALELRSGDLLGRMRGFLRKTWKSSASSNEFSQTNAESLSAELENEVCIAERELSRMENDLVKSALTSAAVGAGAVILSGGASWLPAGITTALGLGASLLHSKFSRSGFEARYPAAFFLNLKCRSDKKK
jgi:SEC-C motif-containing protein